MTTINKSFTVKLSVEEVLMITDGLHLLFKEKQDSDKLPEVRTLRNAMASLVNRTYCGKDA